MAMRVLGIDLAARPAGTAACEVRWEAGAARVERLMVGLDDPALLHLMAGADRIGIDAPFGWPAAYTEALHHWASHGRWPASGQPELMFRLTDREIRSRTGQWPLTASAGWLPYVAWRCAALLTAHQAPAPVERVGESGVIEAYPGAALSTWGLPRRGYRRDPTVRGRLVDLVLERCSPWLHFGDDDRHELGGSPHALDAFLAVLTTRIAAHPSRPTWPDPDQLSYARSEGWIHVPRPEDWGLLADGSW